MRDLEKDKAEFLEAIKSTSINELEIEFDTELIQKFSDELTQTKLFLLGETHGVKENADVIYTLFKKFGFRALALEWESKLKPIVEKFVTSGILDFDSISDSPDGRITAGHFALLQKLTEENLLDSLVCFGGNINTINWDERDAHMAQNIINNLSSVPTLVVTGNLHAKTEPIFFGNDPVTHHPMGEHIKKHIPDVLSGKIECMSGTYHNFGIHMFDTKEQTHADEKRFYFSKENLYIFSVSKSHAASVPNPSQKL